MKMIKQFNSLLGGRWKLQILNALMFESKHFGELRRALNGISAKVLTDTLRDMECNGLIMREVYFESTVRVKYNLTEKGYSLLPIIITIWNRMNDLDNYTIRPVEQTEQELKEISAGGRFTKDEQGIYGADFELRLKEAKELIDQADYLILGLGTAFNTAFLLDEHDPGIVRKMFSPLFGRKDGVKARTVDELMNLYAYISPQNEVDYWKFWGEIIWQYCFSPELHAGCRYIKKLIQSKRYFILSSNPDTKLVQAGLEKERFWYQLGNYGWLQCSMSCSSDVWNAENYILPLFHSFDAGQTDIEKYIPCCPYCGEYLVPSRYRNTRNLMASRENMSDGTNYYEFKKGIKDKDRVVFLEIGCGLQMPYVIRYRFESYVAANENSTLIRLNPKWHNYRYKNALQRTVEFTEEIPEVMEMLSCGK